MIIAKRSIGMWGRASMRALPSEALRVVRWTECLVRAEKRSHMLAFVENLEDQHYVQYDDSAQANRNAVANCKLSVSRATPTKNGPSYGSAWLHDRSCRVRSTLLVPAGGGRRGRRPMQCSRVLMTAVRAASTLEV
jgi:hypothetical protein